MTTKEQELEENINSYWKGEIENAYNLGRKEQRKEDVEDEIKFLEDVKVNADDTRIYERLKEITQKLGEMK